MIFVSHAGRSRIRLFTILFNARNRKLSLISFKPHTHMFTLSLLCQLLSANSLSWVSIRWREIIYKASIQSEKEQWRGEMEQPGKNQAYCELLFNRAEIDDIAVLELLCGALQVGPHGRGEGRDRNQATESDSARVTECFPHKIVKTVAWLSVCIQDTHVIG
jgi:hypothetical protein